MTNGGGVRSKLTWKTGLLVLPAVAFFTVFALIPVLAAAYLSFLHWDGVGAPEWAGAKNWVRAFSDSVTIHSIVLTVQVIVLSWVVQTPLSLLLGTFLAGQQRYRAAFGVVYFLPLLFSAVAIGLIWESILGQSGPFNALLQGVGLSSVTNAWLGNTNTALYAIVAVIAWQFIPLHTLLYQAGVRQIPAVLYEAASIDGAGMVRRFFTITIPQLKYTVVTSTILIVNGSITYFDIIFVMTGGGPGSATRILPLHMYITAFQNTEIGYGSAIAVILIAFGLVLSLFLLKVSGFSKMESQAEGL